MVHYVLYLYDLVVQPGDAKTCFFPLSNIDPNLCKCFTLTSYRALAFDVLEGPDSLSKCLLRGLETPAKFLNAVGTMYSGTSARCGCILTV